jgi:hypothetical protein
MTDSMAPRPSHPASSPCVSVFGPTFHLRRTPDERAKQRYVGKPSGGGPCRIRRPRSNAVSLSPPLTLLRTELVLSRLRGRHPALTHREQHGVDAHTTDEGNSSFGSRGLAAYPLAKRQTAFSSAVALGYDGRQTY